MDKIKVLVIEDEWTIAQNTKEILEKLNYAVPAIVATGEEAIQKAMELQPDLVLMDIFLQGKVDGIEAAQHIQSRCNIPVVFLSAYSDAKTLQRANATQPYGYLIKPFTEKTLNTTIQIALSRHNATVELHAQLAAVLDSSDEAVIGEMLDGTIASWNAGAEKIFGYCAAEAIARPISILVPPNCVDEMPQILERIARGEKVEHYETVRMRKDGQLIDVCLTISLLKNATGKAIGVSQIARNLTEDKRNERLHQQQRSLLGNLIEGSTDSIAALDSDFRYMAFNQDIIDRKQAHQKLTFLIQNTPLAAIEWDSQFRVQSWSQRAEEIFGWKAEEVLGKTMHEWRFIFEDDLNRVNQLANRQLNGTSIYTTCENRNYTKDGSVIDCQWYNSVLLDESGNLVSMLSLAHNISDRKQAETACRLSEERLQLALEGSGDAWWDWDIPRGQVNWSPRLWGMLGYEADELPKEFSTWERLMHPDDKPRVMERLNAHLQDSSVSYQLDHRLLAKSGEWKWIATYGRVVVRDETGKPVRMSGTHRDITEYKQAEEERTQLLLQIEYERSRLEAVLMQMPAAIWIVEAPSGKVILDNNKVESVLGHPSPSIETLETLSQYSAIHLDGSPYAAEEYPIARSPLALPLGQSLLTGEVVINEEHLYRKGDGSLATLSLYSSPIYDANGQMIAAVVAAFDITEQKQAQEQIQAALQEKDVLLKEIHDRVKNNLQILSSLLQMQSRRAKSSETVLALRDSQNRIESIALVHEKLYCSENFAIIDFAQYIPALTIHLFDTYNISPDTVKLNIEVDNIFLEIKTGIPCGLIINELVSNSLKHAFTNNLQGEIQIKFNANSQGLLTLIVRDNGIGLPENFDLETPHSLGLTLVYELVDQLEGTLELTRSRGTEFRITFIGNV